MGPRAPLARREARPASVSCAAAAQPAAPKATPHLAAFGVRPVPPANALSEDARGSIDPRTTAAPDETGGLAIFVKSDLAALVRTAVDRAARVDRAAVGRVPSPIRASLVSRSAIAALRRSGLGRLVRDKPGVGGAAAAPPALAASAS